MSVVQNEFHPALPLDLLPPGLHRDLYALWLDKCEADRLPSRSDFDPREMPRLLPNITLFDVENDPQRFRVRLVGTTVVEATGMDNTGHHVDELPCIEHTLERCARLVETRQPYYFADLPMPWSPNSFKSYTVTGLPLASDGFNVDKILGALSFA